MNSGQSFSFSSAVILETINSGFQVFTFFLSAGMEASHWVPGALRSSHQPMRLTTQSNESERSSSYRRSVRDASAPSASPLSHSLQQPIRGGVRSETSAVSLSKVKKKNVSQTEEVHSIRDRTCLIQTEIKESHY